jgi:transposase-like protein
VNFATTPYNCERPEELLGDAGLMKELKIKLMERMSGAELTSHLGYEDSKNAPPDQTNRRNGSFAKRLKGNAYRCAAGPGRQLRA